MLTEEIQSGVEAVRAGNFPLPESGHTVLLGWGARTPTVLREVRCGWPGCVLECVVGSLRLAPAWQRELRSIPRTPA